MKCVNADGIGVISAAYAAYKLPKSQVLFTINLLCFMNYELGGCSI